MGAKKQAKKSFEEALKELDDLVKSLEKGEAPLSELVESYEKGQEILKTCRQHLHEAEMRVRIVEQDGAEKALKDSSGAGS